MKFKFLAMLATIFSLAVMTTSCNDNDNGPENYVYYDIVTFVSQNDNGSTYTLHKDANSHLITYTASQRQDEKVVKPGTRIMIAYQLTDGRQSYTSGPIFLLGFQTVENGSLVEGTAEQYGQWMSAGIQPKGFWVTGNYLNMQFQGMIRNEVKTLDLVVDETTLGNKMPDVYLMYKPDDETAPWKDIVASYDISLIWANMQYDGFVLHVNSEFSSMPNMIEFKRTESIKPMALSF